MSLRDEVEKRLPNWASWYPSVFDAARDLGLIRARVCAPSSLLLSNRHAACSAPVRGRGPRPRPEPVVLDLAVPHAVRASPRPW